MFIHHEIYCNPSYLRFFSTPITFIAQVKKKLMGIQLEYSINAQLTLSWALVEY